MEEVAALTERLRLKEVENEVLLEGLLIKTCGKLCHAEDKVRELETQRAAGTVTGTAPQPATVDVESGSNSNGAAEGTGPAPSSISVSAVMDTSTEAPIAPPSELTANLGVDESETTMGSEVSKVDKPDNTDTFTPPVSSGASVPDSHNSSTASIGESTASATSVGFDMSKFGVRPGHWKCPSCLVQNADSYRKCPCCETDKPGGSTKDNSGAQEGSGLGFTSFSFGGSTASIGASGFSFNAPTMATGTSPAFATSSSVPFGGEALNNFTFTSSSANVAGLKRVRCCFQAWPST